MTAIRARRSDPRTFARRLQGVTLSAVAVCGLALAGCGSSKPSYCSAVSELETSVKALPSTDILSGGTSALQSALGKVKTNAENVVSAAKSDFPTETKALSSSVDALESSAKQLGSSPSAGAAGAVATDAAGVVTAAKNLANATGSKCD